MCVKTTLNMVSNTVVHLFICIHTGHLISYLGKFKVEFLLVKEKLLQLKRYKTFTKF